MRKVFLATALVLSSFTAFAGDDDTAWCIAISELAATVMDNRQNGAPMVDMYTLAKDNEAFQNMIEIAYEKPLFESERYKKQATLEFRNSIFLACIKS